MNAREERGLAIAATCKLKHTPAGLQVPSQSGTNKWYYVSVKQQSCTCPDHQEGGHKCKHIFAAEFTLKREVASDGTVTETQTLTVTKRKTYKQNWTAYNLAQTTERHRFCELLSDLCSGIVQPPRVPGKAGRNPVLLSDAVFAIGYKIFGTLSSRRTSCDLQDAHENGYLSHTIHYNSVNAYLENPAITPILDGLIGRSASPLAAVESEFAVDSSGISSSKFDRWYDEKYGAERKSHSWVKVHLACGTKTHVVSAVRVMDKHSNDSPQFKPLVDETAKTFKIGQVSADMAYLSRDNLAAVEKTGGTAFIPFKSNSVCREVGTLWEKMFAYYTFRKEEFYTHYHRRSNAESVFSMIKRKFGDSVRSRMPVSIVNEVLGKVLCHNICCVIASQCELGIEPIFWSGQKSMANLVENPKSVI